MVSSKLKNYFPQMGIMRTFREHQPLVVCCIIAIVLQIWHTLSVMLYYNNKQFKQKELKMPNEIILANIIVILTTFIFLVLVGVIWLIYFL